MAIWDAKDVLGLRNPDTYGCITCAGYSLSYERRCRRPIAAEHLYAAEQICKALPMVARNAVQRRVQLETLAGHLLCPTNHCKEEDSRQTMWCVEGWIERIEDRLAHLDAEATNREAASREPPPSYSRIEARSAITQAPAIAVEQDSAISNALVNSDAHTPSSSSTISSSDASEAVTSPTAFTLSNDAQSNDTTLAWVANLPTNNASHTANLHEPFVFGATPQTGIPYAFSMGSTTPVVTEQPVEAHVDGSSTTYASDAKAIDENGSNQTSEALLTQALPQEEAVQPQTEDSGVMSEHGLSHTSQPEDEQGERSQGDQWCNDVVERATIAIERATNEIRGAKDVIERATADIESAVKDIQRAKRLLGELSPGLRDQEGKLARSVEPGKEVLAESDAADQQAHCKQECAEPEKALVEKTCTGRSEIDGRVDAEQVPNTEAVTNLGQESTENKEPDKKSREAKPNASAPSVKGKQTRSRNACMLRSSQHIDARSSDNADNKLSTLQELSSNAVDGLDDETVSAYLMQALQPKQNGFLNLLRAQLAPDGSSSIKEKRPKFARKVSKQTASKLATSRTVSRRYGYRAGSAM